MIARTGTARIGIGALLLTTFLTGAGCASGASEAGAGGTAAYRSVWAELFPDTLGAPRASGSLEGDFHAALNFAATLSSCSSA